MYADDTTLYITTEDLESGSALLNKDLNTINRWANQWLVTFCPQKTVYMHISTKSDTEEHPPVFFDGKQLEEVNHHKHLGVTFSNNLTWTEHVNGISKSASKCIGAMKKLKHSVDRKTLNTIYLTFIRPKLEYASLVWQDCTNYDSENLESLQLDAARVVTGAKRGTSHELIYRECGWPLLSKRREESQMVLFYKMQNDMTPEYLSELVPPTVGTNVGTQLRNRNKLRGIRCRTSKFQKSFLPNAVNVWNKLDSSITTSDSLESFKEQIITSSKCREIYMHGTRKYSMIHAQMRMMCSNLKSHLHSLHVVDDPSCMCGHQREDNKHFLLHCPLYNDLRETLIQFFTANGIDFTLNNLLYGLNGMDDEDINRKLFDHVHTYIQMTERF